MFKLHVLRFLLLVALRVAYAVKRQDRYAWLLHYVEGTGAEQWVSTPLLREILPTLVNEWAYAVDNECNTLVKAVKAQSGWIYRIGLWSTTLYEGTGFSGRPECFYILGCFTFTVKEIRDPHMGEVVVVEGADRYDWHSVPQSEWCHDSDGNQVEKVTEQWYTSPMPLWFAWVMGLVFGRGYFPTAGFPMGQPGISNRLWADLEKVGAKPFKTRFRLVVPDEEWDRLMPPPNLH